MISFSIQEFDGAPPKVIIDRTNITITDEEDLILNFKVQSIVPSTITVLHEHDQLKTFQSK